MSLSVLYCSPCEQDQLLLTVNRDILIVHTRVIFCCSPIMHWSFNTRRRVHSIPGRRRIQILPQVVLLTIVSTEYCGLSSSILLFVTQNKEFAGKLKRSYLKQMSDTWYKAFPCLFSQFRLAVCWHLAIACVF